MAEIEFANESDNGILKQAMALDNHADLAGYEINVVLYKKYGKRDKDGNLKAPALANNGVPVVAKVKLVSAFNRLTDEADVKILLNNEMWDELDQEEKLGVIDNCLTYVEVKTDKEGEPVFISEDSTRPVLKLKKPDFCIEGFLSMLDTYQKSYIPWAEAKTIVQRADG